MEKNVGTEFATAFLRDQLEETKKILNEPFPMVFDGKEKQIPIRKAVTGRMVDVATELFKESKPQPFMELMNTIREKAEKEKKELDLEYILNYTKENPCEYTENEIKAYFYDKENFIDRLAIENQRKITVGIFRELIDTKNLTTQEKEMILSPYDSDFWKEQDYYRMRIFVEFFRRKIV